jgi:type VI secretion system protein ImpM
MLQRLISGKLPAHPDFVRSRTRHGDVEAWQSWLSQHANALEMGPVTAVPVAFVLPPGTLALGPRRFVLGVMVPSLDRAGRPHPLIAYQQAHPRWVRRHFEDQHEQPRDWLFWLARAVARHMALRGIADMQALKWSVDALWQLHAPSWRALGWGASRQQPTHVDCARAHALLGRWAQPAYSDDRAGPAQGLSGVRHLPWADWPQRLHRSDACTAFWQQDAAGGYVNASTRLEPLWRGQS